jgi:hypothetical protein
MESPCQAREPLSYPLRVDSTGEPSGIYSADCILIGSEELIYGG